MNGTWSIRGLEQGFGTPFCLVGQIDGLGQTINAHDVPFTTEDGSWAGAETYAARFLSFPMTIAPPDPKAPGDVRRRYVMARLAELTAAWARIDVATEGTELALDLRVDGISPSDQVRFYGRPRGPLQVDSSLLHSAGALRVRAQFAALDPFGYDTEQTVVINPGSTVTVVNAGEVPSKRWTASFAAGSTGAKLAHEDGVLLDFDGHAIASNPYVADGHAWTVVQAGVNRFGHLTEVSDFFELAPGDNDLTYTVDAGAGAVTFKWRSAYG